MHMEVEVHAVKRVVCSLIGNRKKKKERKKGKANLHLPCLSHEKFCV